MNNRRWPSVLASLSLVLTPVFAGAAARLGKPVPDFTLPASDGQTYHLSDYKGKFVVLEWFNKDCPFTHKHYGSGNMQRLQDTYVKKGVVWFSICSSAPGKLGYLTREDAAQHRIDNHVHSTATLLDPDGKVGRLFGAKTTPHMFVINPQGALIYDGAIDDHAYTDEADIPQSVNYVALALDQAMAGLTVQTPYSRPYGCSVKYK
jgi:peroxiredoxin